MKKVKETMTTNGASEDEVKEFEKGAQGFAKKIIATIAPRWLRIGGYWYPRGGIPIDVFWQTGAAPEGVWLPDQGVPPYRGRG